MNVEMRNPRLALAAVAALVIALMPAGAAVAEEDYTVAASIVVPESVTVQQGRTAEFEISATGTGTLPCGATGLYAASPRSFSFSKVPFSGEWRILPGDLVNVVELSADADCVATWQGAPEPATIRATFFAPCDAPIGSWPTAIATTKRGLWPGTSGASSPVHTTFVVEAGNCPPVAQDDSYTVMAGGTLSVPAPGILANDTDAEGDAIRLVAVTPPTHGVLSAFPGGNFTYTPQANFAGVDSFTYRARDEMSLSNVATVWISVTDPTPPTVGYSLSAEPNSAGWFREPVDLTWSIADPESPISEEGCVDVTVAVDGEHTYSCTATSAGGKTGPVTVTVDYDGTPPSLIASVTDGARFALGGSLSELTAEPDDDGSGIDDSSLRCDTIDTTIVGLYEASCSVSDIAGNETTATIGYSVTHAFGGFLAPLPRSLLKAGARLPVKFTATDAAGGPGFNDLSVLRARIVGSDAEAVAACAFDERIAAYQCSLKTPGAKGDYQLLVEEWLGTKWVPMADADAVAGSPLANGAELTLR